MQYIETKNVYINRDELIEIRAIEHDIKSRFIDFRFLSVNNVIDLTYSTVRVFALNSKGIQSYDELTIIDGKKGLARLELTDDLLVSGTTEYQLEARDSNGAILSSNIFKLTVSKRLRDDDAIQSSNKFSALDKALEKVDKINEIDVRSKENANNIDKNNKALNKKIDDNVVNLTNKITKNTEKVTENRNNITKLSKRQENTINLYNIISNGSFYGDGRCWECTGKAFWSGSYDGYGFNNRCCGAIQVTDYASGDSAEKYLQTYKAYKIDKNTDYTLNLHYAVEQNVDSMDVFIILGKTENRDYGKAIQAINVKGGGQTDTRNGVPFSYKFNSGEFNWVWVRVDHNGIKPNKNSGEYNWIYISEVAIYKGDTGQVPWIPKDGETYSSNVNIDAYGVVFGDANGTYSNSNNGDLEYTTGGITNKYLVLKYISAFAIPAGNPGTVNVKLPKEFTKRKETLTWGVVPKGYYYNTSGNFFPFHVAVNAKGEAFEQDGYMYCPVEGYCRIQNAANDGDVQTRSINAVLIALA
ncbi:hypothetical protein SV13_03395 [Clostridium perfringens]|uniref:phage baseplate upper protein n=1 Tax=Clostridium perfringens TaxID=1502 RepID=UPI0016B1B2D0|nr:phage baseplate upper protein [Clostridium perfringens]KAF2784852.1 hypothetical protein SV13_03395 [Clostridium perfringens]